MADDFIIPIGADSKGFENNLNNLIQKVDELANKADRANKTISDGLGDAEKKSNDLSKGIDKTGKSLDDANKKSTDLSKNLNKALSDSNKETEKFEKSLNQVNERMELINRLGRNFGAHMADAFNNLDTEKLKAVVNDLVTGLSQEIKIAIGEVDQEELEIVVDSIENAKSATQGLIEFIEYAESQLAKLNPNSEAYKDLADAIQVAKIATDEFNKSTIDSTQTSERITLRIRQLREAMFAMSVEGNKNTKLYREMSKELVTLQREVDRTKAEMRSSFSRTPYLDRMLLATQGVVGGFATLQATIALVGEENEDYERATKRLVATLTLLQGLQANINFLNQVRQGQLGRLNILERVSLTNARAYVVALTAQAKAMTLSSVATGVATGAMRAFRVALMATGIGLVVTALGYLIANWDKVTKKINEFLPVGTKLSDIFDTIEQYAMGVGKAVVNFVTAPIQALIDLLTGASFSEAFSNFGNNLNVIENFQSGYEETREKKHQAHLNELEAQRIEADKRELERIRNRGHQTEEEIERHNYRVMQLQLQEIALRKRMGEDYDDLQREMEDAYDARIANEEAKRREQLENERRANEQRAIEQRRANEERLKLQQRQAEQIRKLNEQIEDYNVRSIADAYEREIQEIRLSTQRKVESIERETALTEEALEKQNQIIKNLREEERKAIAEIEKKKIQDILDLRQEGYEQMLDLMEQTESVELQRIENESKAQIQAIQEQYKNEIEIRERLIELVLEQQARKEKEVRDKYQNQALDEEEKRLILMVELSSEYALKNQETEIQKQIAILNIQREFAQKRLDALIESGANENDIAVLQLKQLIQTLEGEISSLETEGGKFNLFSFLGIGTGLSTEERQAIGKAVNTTMQSLKEMSDYMIQQYDRQIQQREKNIESIEKEISALENQLSYEKQLQDEGYANRANVIQAEISALEEQKALEIQMQEEALEAKKKIQRQQILADTLVQSTNLITSATEIFKALSGIPFVGVPLAIATIATMFGAFAAAKIQAFQAVNEASIESFGEGGIIDGKSHAQGGVKYYSKDGRKVKELEGGEFVISKKQTSKYRDLLDAINTDTFDISELAKTHADSKEIKMMFGDDGILKSIDKGINRLNDKESVQETETHIIVKKGNSIRRIRK